MDDDMDVIRGIGNAVLVEAFVVVILLLISHVMGWW